MAADVTLLQFARAPVPGRVKTRMLSELSAEAACELHRELVLWTCGQLLQSHLGQVQLGVAGDSTDDLFLRCRKMGAAAVFEQQGVDLGERMLSALQDALQTSPRAILVGSDCPAISPAYLQQAMRALDTSDVVIGPADDGGFVLIGVTALHAAMFSGVVWGSAQVYAATTANLKALDMSWQALPALPDIDRPEDLRHWDAVRFTAG